ncbi:MAG: aminomethyltransferase family protein, partial [Hyphomicrobiales bacterium]|nr:aminomethyltransferase family protein [Hyphomicrobiales bacterium]
GIMDISAFAKVEITGPDAAALIDRLIPNRLPSEPGRIALTHLLNENGRIDVEATIVRMADDRFYFTCAAFFEQRMLDYFNLRRRDDETVTITNLSNEWGAVTLNGPRSRDILGACTDAKLDNDSFPWLRAREIEVAGKPMWAFRMSYAGELGWEFHGARDNLPAVYEALWAAGEPHDIADYGSFAMNAMRMEKMFKGAGELTNEVTLPEADVMRFVKLDKPDFAGKAATEASAAKPLPWVCAYMEIETDGVSDGHGGEAVLADGVHVGLTSSVAYGHGVQRLLAFAYVKPEHAAPGNELEVMIMGEPRPAVVLGEPVYDAANSLPRS